MPKLNIKLERKTDANSAMMCEDNGNSNSRLLSDLQEEESAADGFDEDSSSFQSSSQSSSAAYMMDGFSGAMPMIPNMNAGMMMTSAMDTTDTTGQQHLLAAGLTTTSGETMKTVLQDFSNATGTDLDEKVRNQSRAKQQVPQTNRRGAKCSGRKQTALVKAVTRRSLNPCWPPLPPLPPLTRCRANRIRSAVSENGAEGSFDCQYGFATHFHRALVHPPPLIRIYTIVFQEIFARHLS